jgi:VIT1/CCC1 family predicted Fe2+/Mn2+ transporter
VLPAQALRNWELMEKYSADAAGDRNRDPFYITTSMSLQRHMFTEAGFPQDIPPADGRDRERPQLLLGSRPGRKRFQDLNAFLMRFIFAVCGALSLLVPTVVMVVTGGTLVTLLIVAVSVLLFAFAVALWGEDQSPSTVLGVVATYTAVLVVFIGTST